MGNVVGQTNSLVRNAAVRPVRMDMGNAVGRAVNLLRNAVGRGSVPKISQPYSQNFGFKFEEKELETEDSLWAMYERWIHFHNLPRSIEAKHKRFDTFKDVARYVHNFNKEQEKKKLLHEDFMLMGLTMFSDFSEEEFLKYSKGELSLDGSDRVRAEFERHDERVHGESECEDQKRFECVDARERL